jgi:predicted N-acetyltransferase YhbS
MNLTLRQGTREDAAACGVIDFEAFKSISSQHNFPWDFPSEEVATAVTAALLSNPGFYAVVAERDGKIVGSNFLDERNPISGVGPISVDPAAQNQNIGRRLMLAVMERSAQRGFAGCRLCRLPITIGPCAYIRSSASKPANPSRKCSGYRQS